MVILIVTLISNFILGGDAISGKVENGKYYVWDAIHKQNENGEKLFKEVSISAYYFNFISLYVCLLMMPFALFFRIKEIFLRRSENKKYKKEIN
jgi:hypothetical protein